MNSHGHPECMSCGRPLKAENRKQKHGPNSVPTMVDCCWDCWTQIAPDKRILITIAIRDRLAGGVLSEMAAALDRLDASRSEDEPGDDWRAIDG